MLQEQVAKMSNYQGKMKRDLSQRIAWSNCGSVCFRRQSIRPTQNDSRAEPGRDQQGEIILLKVLARAGQCDRKHRFANKPGSAKADPNV